ncbi:5'-nucleotidase C-terminal domain-containing protein [Cellulophaga sp. HaHaR_3_176]|uniref:5'-nucleotidase C-terminal domain-containing protein n=1 Tax=Cellulophaga sp. HaHaR_3_176 TaxID=1942464 RepID=UPI001C1F342C|nr:5'-nucleotidase [Cellulophaga sp. HaHaR_3_176]QWX82553.1 5'-nucleotidase C-terminal domain-containing protein [Cellulophaga sp. HaHaR_3_176]
MILKIKQIVIIITLISVTSCKEEPFKLSEIAGKQIVITDSISETTKIKDFIAPFQKHIDKVLDSTLAYAPYKITKEDGEFNTTAGNLMADAVLELVQPVFFNRTRKNVDFVLLNHGGIRSIISKGNVTTRTAYEVMPFENTIMVASLKGKAVRELVNYLIKSKRPHPISGIQIIINNDESINAVNIQNKPFDENKVYYIATSNYLVNGGDHMDFFKEHISLTETDYLIRNIMIDYFEKNDTIAPIVDDRFVKLDK